MEKRKNYYIVIGCIVLLILLSGIGIYLTFNKKEESNEEKEITEKISYKILKENTNYFIEKENQNNLEELGEYFCESKECESIVSYNNQDAKFIIYDNGYRFISFENNKINVQELEELNKDTIQEISLKNNDVIVEYKNNLVGIYEVESNQLKELLLGEYTFNKIENNKVVLLKKESFVVYDLKEKKIMNTIFVPTNDFQVAENDQNTIYIVYYSLPYEIILNRIYDKNGEFLLDQGYFQALLQDGTIVMTDEVIPYITGCGQMLYGYNNIQNFKIYQESTLIKTSKSYKSFMGFKNSDKKDYFIAVDENNNLNLYDKEENVLFQIEEWNEEKILAYWKIENNQFIFATGKHDDEFFTEYVYDLSGNIMGSQQVFTCQF